MRIVFLLALIVLTAGSCGHKREQTAFTVDPLLYAKTVKRLNDVVLQNNFPPMIASRNYVYACIAAYECVAAGDSSYLSLSGQIRHLPPMPKADPSKTTDFRLAALLSLVKVGNAVTFPEGVLMSYYEELKKNASAAGMTPEVLRNTVVFSDTVSAAILRWSKGDQYAKTRSTERYNILVQEGRWVPTPPAYATAIEPRWCDIRPMILDSSDHFKAPEPPAYNMKDSASVFWKEVMEVKASVDHLTEDQKHMADFFDDNPFKLEMLGHVAIATKKFSPPGHWINIVGIAAGQSNADFNKTVASYAATAIALFDGFIACWKSKFTFNTVRPETVINKYIDADWQPYIQTPPFPSYVSGHSVISAASAETMTAFYGDGFAYTDTSLNEFGIRPRSFRSFREASLEASWSRLYGGIHYRSDLENGNELGKKIGAYIVQRIQWTNNEKTLSYK